MKKLAITIFAALALCYGHAQNGGNYFGLFAGTSKPNGSFSGLFKPGQHYGIQYTHMWPSSGSWSIGLGHLRFDPIEEFTEQQNSNSYLDPLKGVLLSGDMSMFFFDQTLEKAYLVGGMNIWYHALRFYNKAGNSEEEYTGGLGVGLTLGANFHPIEKLCIGLRYEWMRTYHQVEDYKGTMPGWKVQASYKLNANY